MTDSEQTEHEDSTEYVPGPTTQERDPIPPMPEDMLTEPLDPPEPPPLPERSTEHPEVDTSYLPFDVVPEEGESYMDAYTRVLREKAGIVETEPDETDESEVLGVLTGQVPVHSMPIATSSGRRSGKTLAAEQWLAEQEDDGVSE